MEITIVGTVFQLPRDVKFYVVSHADEASAVKMFRRKFGCEPGRVWTFKTYWYFEVPNDRVD